MKNKLLFGTLFFIGLSLNGQELYDPQTLYDAPGGVFDINFVREMDIVFEDPNYHAILVNSFFNAPSYRIPATLTYNKPNERTEAHAYRTNHHAWYGFSVRSC